MHFLEYTFVLDIHIGYTLPTIAEYVSVEYIGIPIYYIHWIYSVNNWGIFDTMMMSLRPSGTVLGKLHFLEYTSVFWNLCQLKIYIYWYLIYSANNWEIYDSWMVLGNVDFL